MTDTERRPSGVRWSVRSRILASILLIAAVGMTVAGVTAFLVQRERTLLEIDDRLVSRVEAAHNVFGRAEPAETSSPSTDGTAAPPPILVSPDSTREALEAIFRRVLPNRNESALGLVGGVPTYIPGTPLDFHIEDDPALVDRVVREMADGRVKLGTSLTGNGQYRYIAAPVTVSIDGAEDAAEAGIYVVAVDVDAQLDELTSAFQTYAFVALAAIVVTGLVGWFVAGRLLRPIRRLRLAASRITARALNERIPVAGRDDVSELTETVNDMLDRIDGAMTGQRQLLDDVRHELKTPITIVRGHLEVVDVTNIAEVKAARALAIDELDRMARLVDDIESLAETQVALALRQTDVAHFTPTVYTKASVIPDHDWVLADVARGTVAVDQGRITQAWLQLADNAAKYSPLGSTIELGSTTRGTTIEFWVADNGPGIAPHVVDRIFERFGRVDTGRGIRGSGLGLPIVKAIAQAHGGTVTLASSSSGSRFAIVIPLVDSVQPVQPERAMS